MYAKTNPRAGQLTRRQKRVFAIVGIAVVLAFAGLALWGALAHDSDATSAHGCVSVTVPSSTGGSTFHYCGAQARSFCESAFKNQDQVSLRARPQCDLAGLGVKTASGSLPVLTARPR
jgi:hypothetical protein